MKIMKGVLIGIIVSAFMVGQAYCDPGNNNGKGKGSNDHTNNGNANNNGNSGNSGNNGNNGHANNGNAQGRVDRGNNGSVSQAKGRSEEQKQRARRTHETNQRREAKNRNVQQGPFQDHASANRGNQGRRRGEERRETRASRGRELLDALSHARWSYNPHDTRGQGNMGRVDMQDPLGHEKDSGRKELYGNNGRPVHESEDPAEVPEMAGQPPVEEVLPEVLPPEEFEDLAVFLDFDFSMLGSEQEQWIADWFQQTVEGYYTNTTIQQYYTYEQYYNMWEHHFWPGGKDDSVTGIRVGYNDNLDFTIAPAGLESDNLLVTTTLVAKEDYTAYTYAYDENGQYIGLQYVTIKAGDVLSETTQEAVLDQSTGTYQVSAEIDDSGVPLQQNLAYFVDMNVTVTDPATGTVSTQSYDKSLYLYRCPYGKITNSRTGESIVGAKITVHYEDGSIVALDKATNKTASNPQVTDATGRFGFILQTDRKYYMTAEAEGYEDYKSPVFTEQWHVLREDIEMTPKLDQLASDL